mmetsp:Transcript_15531/g.47392  ORF Transcript_15531/g.47392 Transcript_15531/m.47392 type:complete len:208 (+) Transcript_15531:111-734(+)
MARHREPARRCARPGGGRAAGTVVQVGGCGRGGRRGPGPRGRGRPGGRGALCGPSLRGRARTCGWGSTSLVPPRADCGPRRPGGGHSLHARRAAAAIRGPRLGAAGHALALRRRAPGLPLRAGAGSLSLRGGGAVWSCSRAPRAAARARAQPPAPNGAMPSISPPGTALPQRGRRRAPIVARCIVPECGESRSLRAMISCRGGRGAV